MKCSDADAIWAIDTFGRRSRRAAVHLRPARDPHEAQKARGTAGLAVRKDYAIEAPDDVVAQGRRAGAVP
jgi:hypothetical protein